MTMSICITHPPTQGVEAPSQNATCLGQMSLSLVDLLPNWVSKKKTEKWKPNQCWELALGITHVTHEKNEVRRG